MTRGHISPFSSKIVQAFHDGLENFETGLSEKFWQIYISCVSIDRSRAIRLGRQRLEDLLQAMLDMEESYIGSSIELDRLMDKPDYASLQPTMIIDTEDRVIDLRAANSIADLAAEVKPIDTLESKGVTPFGSRPKRGKSRLNAIAMVHGFSERKGNGFWLFEKVLSDQTATISHSVENGGYSTSFQAFYSLQNRHRKFTINPGLISPQLLFLQTSSLRLIPDQSSLGGYRWGRRENGNECLFNAGALFPIVDQLLNVVRSQDLDLFGTALND